MSWGIMEVYLKDHIKLLFVLSRNNCWNHTKKYSDPSNKHANFRKFWFNLNLHVHDWMTTSSILQKIAISRAMAANTCVLYVFCHVSNGINPSEKSKLSTKYWKIVINDITLWYIPAYIVQHHSPNGVVACAFEAGAGQVFCDIGMEVQASSYKIKIKISP